MQPTAAQWDLDVALPAEQKGTHMSRFVAWLDALDEPLDARRAARAAGAHARRSCGASEGRIEARFPFFLRKRAPVSGVQSLLDYQGRWIAETRAGVTAVWAEVGVPVKTLCPCSKEISDYGAHNQRSHVTIRVELLQPIEWHELVRFAEDAASSEIWPMLKRADEKWVTERAYENPKFVEDLVRDVALRAERRRAHRPLPRRRRELRVDPQPQRLSRASSALERAALAAPACRGAGAAWPMTDRPAASSDPSTSDVRMRQGRRRAAVAGADRRAQPHAALAGDLRAAPARTVAVRR